MKNNRKKQHITRKKLGEILNVNPMTIYYWETGRNTPRCDQIKKIMDFLHIPNALAYSEQLITSLPSPPEEIAQKNSTAE